MANVLTEVIPKLLAQALPVLREHAVMPQLVNRTFEPTPGERFSKIDIPIASAIEVQDVTPGATPPATADSQPTSVSIVCDKWKEAPFYLSDKDVLECMNGTIPMMAASAVKAVANQVNKDLLALHTKVYGFAGTPGTTPFATGTAELSAARKVLAKQLAASNPRFFVLDPEAEANATELRQVQDASFKGDRDGLTNAIIGRLLGFDWAMDQLVPEHTTGAAGTTIAVDLGDGYAAGVKTVHMDGFSTKPSAGDKFTFANHAQTYTVVSSTTLVGTDSDVTFEPALKTAVTDEMVVTFKASFRANLAFHRDAFALVSRPLAGADMGLGNMQAIVDPVTKLVLRLEVTREHKRTRWSFDCLYGVGAPLPEYAVIVAG